MATIESPRQIGSSKSPISQNGSNAIATAAGVPILNDLRGQHFSAEFIEKIPIAFARQHGILGLAGEGAKLTVVVKNLCDLNPLQTVARFLGRPVAPVLLPAEELMAAINLAYQQRTGQAKTLIDKLDRVQVLAEVNQARQMSRGEDLLDVGGHSPVIKLVNLVLFEAVQARASDVHVQPYEQTLVVRLRVDGVLYDSFEIPKDLQEEVVSRIKVMGHMNIAEKRLPQDGRATVQVGDRAIDLRIATLPTTFGERAVIRLLDKGVRLYTATELGMEAAQLERFRQLIKREHGLILVTGPTGSGKTTTLYAALREIDSKQHNILTLEDPVEYRLEGISQTQVSEKKGMTFASGLRNVLRQDPDIIMVGEIRDRETAVMAIQSALTGHLVFSTLHTNDAASAVARLLDLGIEPYLLASSLVGVLAQRLVRRVCPVCAKPASPTPDGWKRLGASAAKRAQDTIDAKAQLGTGCEACRGTGYRGRVGIFELLVADEAICQKIQERATATQIKTAAIASGNPTLRDDGTAKVLAGVTTIDEVVRVTTDDPVQRVEYDS